MNPIRRAQWLLTSDEAERCLELWRSGKFDTADIGWFLQVPEHAVWRTIHAARDIAREMAGA